MKPSRSQLLLLLIASLFLLAVPVLAQTSAAPSEAEVGGKLDTAAPDAPEPDPRSAPPSAKPDTALPDAPEPEPRSAPPIALRPAPGGMQVADKEFVVGTGLVFGSTIANVELTHRCLQSGACSLVPNALVRRRAMYGVSLPADAGITILGYYLKTRGHRWWFVPAAIVTTGNTIYAIHASQHIR